jgi:hypothetical protein
VERSKNGLEVWYSSAEGNEYEESVGIKDIFEKTPSEVIKLSLSELGKASFRGEIFCLQGRIFRTTRIRPILFYKSLGSERLSLVT